MFLGIDLGTSSVKVILLSREANIIATQNEPLSVSRPEPLWSEQDANHWWQATIDAMNALSKQHDLSKVESIGLSGQMHGATLLDSAGDVLRPAILWNDGRSFEQCLQIEKDVKNSRDITGNIMMPGFTAPKLKWVQDNEPEIFAQVDKVLLPKDYLRFKLSGDFASDMSDAAGTMWLDVDKRDWSDTMLAATGLTRSHMPSLCEGSDITGHLSADLAKQWGMKEVPIIGGGGDNAAGAIGVGIINPKQAMLSLGTSGVYFAVSDGFLSNPASALHSFCHALPNTWHSMSVILSAASCLDWAAKITNTKDVPTLLALVEKEMSDKAGSDVIFLPYLSGERTPHNNPNAKGVFFGMTHDTTAAELGLAVLEGVGFAFADGFDAVHDTKLIPDEVTLIGGGARSAYWRQILADITGMKLVFREGGDVGPALGAARLAWLGVECENGVIDADKLAAICPQPKLVQVHEPDMIKKAQYDKKRAKYIELYQALKGIF